MSVTSPETVLSENGEQPSSSPYGDDDSTATSTTHADHGDQAVNAESGNAENGNAENVENGAENAENDVENDVENGADGPENAENAENSENSENGTDGADGGEDAGRGADGPTFADLGLPEAVVRRLGESGVVTPFPIQAATIPDALAGRDILGRGRTGSGKTLSFGLPTLSRLAGGRSEKKRPRGVILTPTRELAMQVSDALQPYGDVLGLRFKVVCGGTSMGNQIYALERGVDVLVATPGRLRDLINRGACSLQDVEIAVLDEADQMSDLGFLPEVTELLDLVPVGGQRMLFSATLEREIDTLVKRYLVNPVSHQVDAAQGAVTTMSHHVLVVKPRDKQPITAAIAGRGGRTIVFVRTQLGADRVADQLREAGVRAEALHGGMTQHARTRTLADFKDGYVNVLVATDVAARGIHVDGIDLVLNVDPAGDHKDYLHRSGRTARAGESGTVVSLALPHQRRTIFRLMEDAGVNASRHFIGGGGVFDDDVVRITGVRSLTEVHAGSATNAARQAEREVQDVTRHLEKLQRRAAELRDEADRLLVRAARERGEDPAVALAEAAAVAEAAEAAETAPEDADPTSGAVRVPAQSGPREGRDDHRRDERRGDRDDRGGYDRRDRDRDRDRDGDRDRDRDRNGRSFQDRREDRDRDDRGGRSGFRRDDRGGRPYERRGDRDDRGGRGGFRRDDRFGQDRREDRDRDDRGGRSGFRRDDRGGRPYERRGDRDDRGGRGGFRRDDRFGQDRRDNRGSFERREGNNRPHNRDRRDDRRPFGRRDDHHGGRSSGVNGNGSRSYDRRADKPRWKRNG